MRAKSGGGGAKKPRHHRRVGNGGNARTSGFGVRSVFLAPASPTQPCLLTTANYAPGLWWRMSWQCHLEAESAERSNPWIKKNKSVIIRHQAHATKQCREANQTIGSCLALPHRKHKPSHRGGLRGFLESAFLFNTATFPIPQTPPWYSPMPILLGSALQPACLGL